MTPQFPQFDESPRRFVQIGPCDPGQTFGAAAGHMDPAVPPQVPIMKPRPAAQASPHIPQFFGSLDRLVQMSPVGDGHAFGAAAGHGAPPHTPI